MKTKKTKTCKSCSAGKSLYSFFSYGFYRHKLYYCTLCKKMTEKESTCDLWYSKKREYDLSAQRFDDAENDVYKLQEYLKDFPFE